MRRTVSKKSKFKTIRLKDGQDRIYHSAKFIFGDSIILLSSDPTCLMGSQLGDLRKVSKVWWIGSEVLELIQRKVYNGGTLWAEDLSRGVYISRGKEEIGGWSVKKDYKYPPLSKLAEAIRGQIIETAKEQFDLVKVTIEELSYEGK